MYSLAVDCVRIRQLWHMWEEKALVPKARTSVFLATCCLGLGNLH